MTKEIIQEFISRYKGMHLADDLAGYMQKCITVRNTFTVLYGEQCDLIKRHKRELAALNEKFLKLRESCPHPEITFSPDPSGGNDSSRQCTYCGKDF